VIFGNHIIAYLNKPTPKLAKKQGKRLGGTQSCGKVK
jgi:hypothetical protein